MKEIQRTPTSLYTAWVSLIVLCIACVVVWQQILAQQSKEKLIVAFLDVGQGDSIYIETPHGNQVLIDGGKGKVVLRELGKAMSFYDRSIDVLVATHPDADHIEGLPEIFSRYEVGMYIESGVKDDTLLNQTLHQRVKEEGLKIVDARQDMHLMLDTDVSLRILFPDRNVENVETNTASIVAHLQYKNISFMFTGDSPAGIETYLTTLYGEGLKSDVLKLGHHGSKTSTADLFLGYVDPEYAVVSAGCDNAYGHPHAEVLEKLTRFGIQTLSTCEHGTIVFESNGSTVSTSSL